MRSQNWHIYSRADWSGSVIDFLNQSLISNRKEVFSKLKFRNLIFFFNKKFYNFLHKF